MAAGIFNHIYELINEKNFLNRRTVRWVLAVIVAVIMTVSYRFGIFDRLELMTLDWRFALKNAARTPSDIVFIEMSEDSIEAIGRWPWHRRWHAALIEALSKHSPRAIAFDVLFSEPQDPEDDGMMAAAIERAANVYLPLCYNLSKQDGSGLSYGIGVSSAIIPIEEFQSRIKGTGHINAIPDMDGVLRRVPAVISFGNTKTCQFGMKIGFDLMGVNPDDIIFDPKEHYVRFKTPDNKNWKMPLGADNQLMVNWKHGWVDSFKHYSFIDVIRSHAAIKEGRTPIIDLGEFKDKICIVGLTAAGHIDIKPTPIESAYPASGVNAVVMDSVLNKDFLRELPPSAGYAVILFVSLAMTLCLSNIRLLGGALLAAAAAAIYFLLSLLSFKYFNTVIPAFYPALAILVSYAITSVYTQAMQAIERARLFKQATRDGLTGLYNIRHFNLLLEAEFRNVSMYKFRKLAIIMADIDNFKKANDTYGHQAGDQILKETARIMQAKCRQTDIVARYGGEEFIVMISGASARQAHDIGEKIRLALEARRFRFKNADYRATISMGLAEYSDEKSKDELVEKADKALYEAKRSGKNKVCLYQPSASI